MGSRTDVMVVQYVRAGLTLKPLLFAACRLGLSWAKAQGGGRALPRGEEQACYTG